ncbi:hypothetical protein BCR44DRAFT_26804 [Catenaria anguillulae PL171]|uniref:Uncharacterized protein n=1 Tax=Catenaria anguillulae PL171 TaxID=765915 RepID=A0A1Y2HR86_9FUNG|nr:hypothetical protein BCR44DRAFT_26804 [Catenaria anguillulae PL171]
MIDKKSRLRLRVSHIRRKNAGRKERNEQVCTAAIAVVGHDDLRRWVLSGGPPNEALRFRGDANYINGAHLTHGIVVRMINAIISFGLKDSRLSGSVKAPAGSRLSDASKVADGARVFTKPRRNGKINLKPANIHEESSRESHISQGLRQPTAAESIRGSWRLSKNGACFHRERAAREEATVEGEPYCQPSMGWLTRFARELEREMRSRQSEETVNVMAAIESDSQSDVRQMKWELMQCERSGNDRPSQKERTLSLLQSVLKRI